MEDKVNIVDGNYVEYTKEKEKMAQNKEDEQNLKIKNKAKTL